MLLQMHGMQLQKASARRKGSTGAPAGHVLRRSETGALYQPRIATSRLQDAFGKYLLSCLRIGRRPKKLLFRWRAAKRLKY